jgi:hypothetical protein
MNIQSFDTHTYVKQLTESGVPMAQAEALASIRLEMVDFSNRVEVRFAAVDRRFDDVDRRFDAMDRRFDEIDHRFVEFDRRLVEFEARIEAKFDKKLEAMRADMIKWMFGFFVTQLAATLTMIKYLT